MPINTTNKSLIVPDGYVMARNEHGWAVHPPIDDSAMGTMVRVAGYGYGATMHDDGLFGRVVGVGRTRLKVELLGHHPSNHDRQVLSVGAPCLQVWITEDEIAPAV